MDITCRPEAFNATFETNYICESRLPLYMAQLTNAKETAQFCEALYQVVVKLRHQRVGRLYEIGVVSQYDRHLQTNTILEGMNLEVTSEAEIRRDQE